MLRALALLCLIAPVAGARASPPPLRLATLEPVVSRALPPKTPDGLPQCEGTLKPIADLPRGVGEAVRYIVDVNGLSLGTVDFKIERQGTYGGQAVTEYRSAFKLDSLVAAFLPVEGRAASLVPASAFAPVMAMNRYRLDQNQFEEDVSFSRDGLRADSKRMKNGKQTAEQRAFPDAAIDFVSGFYWFRSLPERASGCTYLYGNQRAYTVWVSYEGVEGVATPVGTRPAHRYGLRYANDKSKKPIDGTVWVGTGEGHLPLRARVLGEDTLEARVHRYELSGAAR